MLLTTGEQVSIALLAMAFKSLGQPAISLTGPMAGMRTDSVHTKGRIKDIQPKRVHEELDKAISSSSLVSRALTRSATS